MPETNVDSATGAMIFEFGPKSMQLLERIARALEGGAQPSRAQSAPAAAAPPPRTSGATFPNYGRSKGAPVAGASMGDLEYYANGCRRTLNDPEKSRYHDKERALLDAIEAEIRRQGGAPDDFGPPPPGFDGPSSGGGAGRGDPGPSDEDIPFITNLPIAGIP